MDYEREMMKWLSERPYLHKLDFGIYPVLAIYLSEFVSEPRTFQDRKELVATLVKMERSVLRDNWDAINSGTAKFPYASQDRSGAISIREKGGSQKRISLYIDTYGFCDGFSLDKAFDGISAQSLAIQLKAAASGLPFYAYQQTFSIILSLMMERDGYVKSSMLARDILSSAKKDGYDISIVGYFRDISHLSEAISLEWDGLVRKSPQRSFDYIWRVRHANDGDKISLAFYYSFLRKENGSKAMRDYCADWVSWRIFGDRRFADNPYSDCDDFDMAESHYWIRYSVCMMKRAEAAKFADSLFMRDPKRMIALFSSFYRSEFLRKGRIRDFPEAFSRFRTFFEGRMDMAEFVLSLPPKLKDELLRSEIKE